MKLFDALHGSIYVSHWSYTSMVQDSIPWYETVSNLIYQYIQVQTSKYQYIRVYCSDIQVHTSIYQYHGIQQYITVAMQDLVEHIVSWYRAVYHGGNVGFSRTYCRFVIHSSRSNSVHRVYDINQYILVEYIPVYHGMYLYIMIYNSMS